ncbi:uncharacterized protein LOC143975937 [Lithobates pipiens]
MSLSNVQHQVTELCTQSVIFRIAEIVLFYTYMKIKTLSSPNSYKSWLFWIVLRMTFFIYKTQSSEPIFKVQFGVREFDLDFYQEGDLIIGGVFTIATSTVHDTGIENNTRTLYCQIAEQTPINVLAFISAIHNVNQNPEILPNITLGFHVLDSCLHPCLAVKDVLSILSGLQKTVPNYSCSGEAELVGFIGDHYSVTTIPMAQILGIYGYTQISYGATDYSLTNRLLYPHVFRTVQNDHVHYMAVIKLLKHFSWTWVGIFASQDDAGDKDKEILIKYMKSNGICVEYSVSFWSSLYAHINEEQIRNNVIFVIKNSSAKVIVLCGSFISNFLFYNYFIDNNVICDKTFIVPPLRSLSSAAYDPYELFNGSLSLDLHPLFIPNKEIFFDRIDKTYTLNNSSDSIFFLSIAKCMSENKENRNNTILCPLTYCGSLEEEMYPNLFNILHQGLSPRIYYAVEVMAKALHDINLFYKEKIYNKHPHYYRHKHTLSRRRQLNNTTKMLRNNQVQYQRIAPAKISITYNGSKHTVYSVLNGMSLLQEWSIIPDTSDTTLMDQSTIRNLQVHPLPQSRAVLAYRDTGKFSSRPPALGPLSAATAELSSLSSSARISRSWLCVQGPAP